MTKQRVYKENIMLVKQWQLFYSAFLVSNLFIYYLSHDSSNVRKEQCNINGASLNCIPSLKKRTTLEM